MKIITEQRQDLFEPIPTTDDVSSGPILQIMVMDQWILTTKEIWESWTGLRRINGDDYHGDVFPLFEPDKKYTGSRVCPCSVCQAHAEAKYRPN